MIVYKHCPVCSSDKIAEVFKAKDYTVSQQLFEVWHCANCTFRFTQNIPEQNEIGKYYQSDNYISHSDTTKGLINNLYHKVRKFSLKSKRNLVQHQTKINKGTILDIGCGTGAFLNEMQQNNWEIKGLEPDEIARAKAEELYKIVAFSPQQLFELEKNKFDAITMWHVLEHVHELKKYLQQIHTLLKPNGKFFIAVPNYTSYDAAFYKQNWAAYDVPRHLYHFSPQSMKQLVEQFGFKLTNIKPMWFDSFYVSMLSEKNNEGNVIKAFFVGLVSNIKTIFNKQKCSSIIYVLEKAK